MGGLFLGRSRSLEKLSSVLHSAAPLGPAGPAGLVMVSSRVKAEDVASGGKAEGSLQQQEGSETGALLYGEIFPWRIPFPSLPLQLL